MFIRIDYEQSVDTLKERLRAKARPRDFDNLTKQSSTLLYRFYGNLVILYYRPAPWSVRFAALFLPKKGGGARLVGVYGHLPFEPVIALPVLGMLALALLSAQDLRSALTGALLVLLLPYSLHLLLQLLLQWFLSRRLGPDKDYVPRFLRELGESVS